MKQNKSVNPKYYVHKNAKKTGHESDYLSKPFKVDSETKHTETVEAETETTSGSYWCSWPTSLNFTGREESSQSEQYEDGERCIEEHQ